MIAWSNFKSQVHPATAVNNNLSLKLSAKNSPRFDYKSDRYHEFLDEFCEASSIHGIKYIGDRKLHWIERLWWLVAVVLSVYGCYRLIQESYDRWNRSPVIVTFSEKSASVWNIPFPAVTICPEVKTNAQLFNFTETVNAINRVSAEELKRFPGSKLDELSAVGQVCYTALERNQFLRTNSQLPTFANSDLVNVLKRLRPNLGKMFQCQWKNKRMNCTNIFSLSVTNRGICYTFNNLDESEIFRQENLHQDFKYYDQIRPHSTEWDLETGYSEKATWNSYPERVSISGDRGELSAIFPLTTADVDHLCTLGNLGIRIALHAPGDLPDFDDQYIQLAPGRQLRVVVKPNLITTSNKLNDYSFDRRACYFQSERYLRFFRSYSQSHCELECLTNYTLKVCGCVQFHMPRNSSTPICGLPKMQCYKDAAIDLYDHNNGGQSHMSCDCMPTCTELTYDVESTHTSVNIQGYIKAMGEDLGDHGINGSQPSILDIMFRENQFLACKRSELYGSADFLANCGGLLGLFMGVSILSLVELLYFFTVHIWYIIVKHKDGQAGEQNKVVTLA